MGGLRLMIVQRKRFNHFEVKNQRTVLNAVFLFAPWEAEFLSIYPPSLVICLVAFAMKQHSCMPDMTHSVSLPYPDSTMSFVAMHLLFNPAFTPKASSPTSATSCHSFSMNTGNDGLSGHG